MQRCGKWDHNHLRGDHCAWLSPESRSRQRHSGRCTGAVLTVDIRTIAETGSTNADLLSLAGQQAIAEGFWLRAERQRSEEHTSELQSLMRISYAVFCLKKKKKTTNTTI